MQIVKHEKMYNDTDIEIATEIDNTCMNIYIYQIRRKREREKEERIFMVRSSHVRAL